LFAENGELGLPTVTNVSGFSALALPASTISTADPTPMSTTRNRLRMAPPLAPSEEPM
jgi:hypothetical protein